MSSKSKAWRRGEPYGVRRIPQRAFPRKARNNPPMREKQRRSSFELAAALPDLLALVLDKLCESFAPAFDDAIVRAIFGLQQQHVDQPARECFRVAIADIGNALAQRRIVLAVAQFGEQESQIGVRPRLGVLREDKTIVAEVGRMHVETPDAAFAVGGQPRAQQDRSIDSSCRHCPHA